MESSLKKSLLAIALIAAAGFVLYANSLSNGFVYDDDLVIKNNAFLGKPGNLKYLFTRDYYAASGEYTYRPVLTLTYIIDYHFWKTNPFGYHLTNILFHIGAAVFLYLFVLLLIPMLDAKIQPYPAALLSAIIFIAHPIQTEVVNSPAFRDDAVMAFFFFPVLILYLKAKFSEGFKRYAFFSFSMLCYVLALFAKETVVIILPVIVLIDICVRSNDKGLKTPLVFMKENILPYLGYVAITALYLYIMFFALANPDISRRPESIIKFSIYRDILLVGSQRMFSYIMLLLFPFNLMVERVTPRAYSIFQPEPLLALLVIAVLAILAILRFRKDRVFSFAVFWLFIFIGPAVLYTYQDIVERFLYLPLVAFSLLVSVFTVRLYARKEYRQAVIIAVAAILFLYSCRVVTRNTVWNNPRVFWEERVRHTPAGARALVNLGVVYKEMGLYGESEALFKKAISIQPNYADAYNNLGNIYYAKGLYDKAAEEFRKSVELSPVFHKSHMNIGNMFFKEGRYADAVKEYEISLKQQPFDPDVNNNIGRAYYMLGRYDEAITYFRKALDIKPDFMDAAHNMATTYVAKGLHYFANGRGNDAIDLLKKAIEIKPDFAEAYYNLGNLYYKENRYDDAISEYGKAVAINPRFVNGYNNMGAAYLAKGMPDKAVGCWNKTISIDPANATAKKNLELINKTP